jgi:hypothetical protein
VLAYCCSKCQEDGLPVFWWGWIASHAPMIHINGLKGHGF